MDITFGLLAIKPRAKLVEGCLIIETPWFFRILSFGFYYKMVMVDPVSRIFSFGRKRSEWTRLIPFEAIERLDYSFAEAGINRDSLLLGSHDSIECYTLSIILRKEGERVVLGRFSGEGSVDHGWKGILVGDDVLDYRGDQWECSLGVVKLLQAMTGLPLV